MLSGLLESRVSLTPISSTLRGQIERNTFVVGGSSVRIDLSSDRSSLDAEKQGAVWPMREYCTAALHRFFPSCLPAQGPPYSLLLEVIKPGCYLPPWRMKLSSTACWQMRYAAVSRNSLSDMRPLLVR
jgi:hypothetical protein